MGVDIHSRHFSTDFPGLLTKQRLGWGYWPRWAGLEKGTVDASEKNEVISSLPVFCETKVLNFGEKKRKRNLLSRGKAGVCAGPRTWQRGQGRNTEEASFQIRWYTGLVEA